MISDKVEVSAKVVPETKPAVSQEPEIPTLPAAEVLRFQPAQIPEDNKTRVIISVGINPDEFFVQLASESSKLDSLTTRLQNFCNTAEKWSADSVYLGLACAAKFSVDGAFYRCIPTSIDNESVKVRLSIYHLEVYRGLFFAGPGFTCSKFILYYKYF